MNKKLQVESYRFQVRQRNPRKCAVSTGNRQPATGNRSGFTLIEVLMTMILLSLIVLALMTVFNSTQSAFRSSLTQTDILESGRLAMGMMTDDLRKTTPSYGYYSSNNIGFFATTYEPFFTNGPVNFFIDANPYTTTNQPFIQYLPGTSAQRSNVLETFYMLSRQNVNGTPSWVGTGYVVDPASYPTNSLYRFSMSTNTMKGLPLTVFSNFINAVDLDFNGQFTGAKRSNPFTNTLYWTHVMDGVVHLTVRPYDPNGLEMTNSVEFRYFGFTNYNLNTYFFTPLFPPISPTALKIYGCYMFSNTVPASVEVNLGIMEDAILQRAEGMSGQARFNYLSNHVAQVHLFRQRVAVRSVDPTAYK